jgi:hypothetical protein
MKHNSVIVSIVLVLFVTACLCSPASFIQRNKQPTNSPQPTITTPTGIIEPSETPILIQEETPTDVEIIPTETQAESSQNPGPWLILSSQTSLWLANSDGSGIRPLIDHVNISQPLASLLQPGGTNLAVVTQKEGETSYDLNLVDIPSGHAAFVTHLGSYTASNGLDADAEAVRAFTEHPAAAWSPDGTTLAFIGKIDGNTADVYLCDVKTHKITQINKDATQNFNPVWSPDGSSLIYFGAETFGTGAGYSMSGFWSVDTSTLKITQLADFHGSGGEEFLEWANPTTAILTSWNPMCGYNSIRKVNLTTQKVLMLRKDCYVSASAADNGSILYGTGEALWYIPPGQVKAQKIMDGIPNRVRWIPQDDIYAVDLQEGPTLTFDRNGQDRQEAPTTGMDSVSMYGAIWAWVNSTSEQPGVWFSGPGLTTTRIFDNPAYTPIWDAQNNLIFFTDSQIYRATFPTYTDVTEVGNVPDMILDYVWINGKE